MELIPHEEIRPGLHFNFAPMIDFLFLMLSLFATLAISRATLYDTEINLASLPSEKAPLRPKQEVQQLHLSINERGAYKWLTEFEEYPMESVQAVQEELSRQYQIGILAKDKTKTEVLLHIDKKAPWESIARLIFGVRELSFDAYPVYESLEKKSVP